ncbi:hypothetical protein SNEBB_005416 [Seison nebaliae]|nr:hypothetical protein SNEBB_005416 [Seison nebaliae]
METLLYSRHIFQKNDIPIWHTALPLKPIIHTYQIPKISDSNYSYENLLPAIVFLSNVNSSNYAIDRTLVRLYEYQQYQKQRYPIDNSFTIQSNSDNVDSKKDNKNLKKLFFIAQITGCGAILLSCLIGNILVILSVLTHRPLKNSVANMFIISLASADLAVALLVIPFHIMLKFTNYLWPYQLGVKFCKAFLTFDVMLCTSSILNLCIIALDRYWAITDPLKYAKRRTSFNVTLMILGVWIISALVSVPPVFGWGQSEFLANATRLIEEYENFRKFNETDLSITILSNDSMNERNHEKQKFIISPQMLNNSSLNDSFYRIILKSHYNISTDQLFNHSHEFTSTIAARQQMDDYKNYHKINFTRFPLQEYSYIDFEFICTVSDKLSYVIYSACGSFYVPVILIFFVYYRIFRATRKRLKRRHAQAKQLANAAAKLDDGKSDSMKSHRSRISNWHRWTIAKKVSHCRYTLHGSNLTNGMKIFNKLTYSQSSETLPKKYSLTQFGSERCGKYNRRSNDVVVANKNKLKLSDNQRHSANTTTTITTTNGLIDDQVMRTSGNNVKESVEEKDDLANGPKKEIRHRKSIFQKRIRFDFKRGSSDKFRSDSNDSTIAPPMSDEIGNDESRTQQFRPTVNPQNLSKTLHRKEKISVKKERRAARMLGIIVGVFVLCWFPFFAYYLYGPLCQSILSELQEKGLLKSYECPLASNSVFEFITWLGYVNSAINPFLYTVFNRDFRTAFSKLLTCFAFTHKRKFQMTNTK